jgi:hypothetical protein
MTVAAGRPEVELIEHLLDGDLVPELAEVNAGHGTWPLGRAQSEQTVPFPLYI